MRNTNTVNPFNALRVVVNLIKVSEKKTQDNNRYKNSNNGEQTIQQSPTQDSTLQTTEEKEQQLIAEDQTMQHPPAQDSTLQTTEEMDQEIIIEHQTLQPTPAQVDVALFDLRRKVLVSFVAQA